MRVLLAMLCLLALVVTVAIAVDEFGAGAPPWFGWWDSTLTVVGPYTLTIAPRTNGAAARSGFRNGDGIDLREQSTLSRIAATYQPITTQPTMFLVRRGARRVALGLAPSTVWDNASFWKLQPMVSRLGANLLFIVCAALIVLRRRYDIETSVLALVFLALVGTMLDPSFFVVPEPWFALTVFMFSRICATGVAVALVWVAWRSNALTVATCIAILAASLSDIAVVVGLSTGRIDPLPFILSLSATRSLLDALVWLLVLLVTMRSALRSLLVPLPVGLFVSSLCFASPAFIHSWFANVATPAIANIAVPLGVIFATRAALQRLRYGADPPPIMTSEAQLHA